MTLSRSNFSIAGINRNQHNNHLTEFTKIEKCCLGCVPHEKQDGVIYVFTSTGLGTEPRCLHLYYKCPCGCGSERTGLISKDDENYVDYDDIREDTLLSFSTEGYPVEECKTFFRVENNKIERII